MSKPDKRLYADPNDESFGKVMDVIGALEGDRLLAEKERLEKIGFTMPESLNERCLMIIRGEKVRSETPVYYRGKRTVRIGLIAVLVAVLMFFSAYAMFSQVREKVNSIVYRVTHRYTEVSTENKPVQNSPLPKVRSAYIPEGFELVREYEGYAFYQNDNGDSFYLSYDRLISKETHILDTEDVEINYINVTGQEYTKLKKLLKDLNKYRIQVIWSNEEKAHTFKLVAVGVNDDEINKVLDNIMIEYREEEE